MNKLLSFSLIAAFAMTGTSTFAMDDTDAAELAAGKRAYNKCRGCHTLTDTGKKRPGPHLANIINRASGSVEGYKYSAALKDANLTWDEETLDAWLKSPRNFLPGNRMTFMGVRKESEREALIAYLKSATGE